MSAPYVSVIIAARNSERYLAAAIESVRAQTFRDFEILVVDGHSTDSTPRIARSFPEVRYLSQPGHGFADAWNIGVAAARGDCIAFLDSDDVWAPAKLALQTACLFDPGVPWVIGRMRFFCETPETLPSGFRRELLDGDHPGYFPGCLLARRRVFDTVGRFDTRWTIVSDVDWFARVKDHGIRPVEIPDVVLHKRVHGDNLSYSAGAASFGREVVQLLKRSIDRQRER